jgi:hypothetical protein
MFYATYTRLRIGAEIDAKLMAVHKYGAREGRGEKRRNSDGIQSSSDFEIDFSE